MGSSGLRTMSRLSEGQVNHNDISRSNSLHFKKNHHTTGSNSHQDNYPISKPGSGMRGEIKQVSEHIFLQRGPLQQSLTQRYRSRAQAITITSQKTEQRTVLPIAAEARKVALIPPSILILYPPLSTDLNFPLSRQNLQHHRDPALLVPRRKP